jgi:opacity protein-like surface antigen
MKVRNMNIKSLILGSAAAIVAAGAAQAADLPVAEPVDYVKVCDAYGAGYFFIPGTDTCLKINGEVVFGMTSHAFDDNVARADDLVDFYTETNITFTAREETEFGTLSAVIELDEISTNNDDGGVTGAGTAFDKAWLSLGGFYAGVTDSLIDFNAGTVYDDFGFGHGDVNAIGYAMAVGNGVTITVAAEEYTGNDNAESLTAAAYWAGTAETAPGTSMPSLAASIAVDQAWGSIVVGGAVFQVRYPNAVFDTDLGWSLGGKASFEIVEGLDFGIAGGYSQGSNSYLPTFNVAGVTGPSAFRGTLMANWAVSAGLSYAFADNVTFSLDAGYEKWIDRTASDLDTAHWGVSAQIAYDVVENLEVAARIGYQKTDFNAQAVNLGYARDWDDVRGRVTITRTF